MAFKTSAEFNLFLSLILFCHILSASAASPCRPNCDTSSSLSVELASNGSSTNATCPMDSLKLGVCADLLGGLVNVTIGTPPTTPCCSLLAGLVDLEAAACLCTAITANVLGLNLNIPVSLSLVLNKCGRQVPNGFTCA